VLPDDDGNDLDDLDDDHPKKREEDPNPGLLQRFPTTNDLLMGYEDHDSCIQENLIKRRVNSLLLLRRLTIWVLLLVSLSLAYTHSLSLFTIYIGMSATDHPTH
jgi:hypothetical protein